MGLSKWEAISAAIVMSAFFGFTMYGGSDAKIAQEKEQTTRILSCNNLKMTAIAASAPEPKCAF